MPDSSPRSKFTVFVVCCLVAFGAYHYFNDTGGTSDRLVTLAYSDFVDSVKQDKIERVEFEERMAYGIFKKAEINQIPALAAPPPSSAASPPSIGTPRTDSVSSAVKPAPPANPNQSTAASPSSFQFRTIVPFDSQLMPLLLSHRVQVVVRPPKDAGFLSNVLFSFGPMILFLVFYWFMMQRMQGGGKGGMKLFSFGKSTAKLIRPEDNKIQWSDVKGIDEAKADLEEIAEFLKNPDKFKDVGGKIPKGVLLSGSPGCGKTHLSRALANEAKAHFYTLSGSDFVEMFVGVGASRVRDMFQEARKHTPAIIFIDEIDAVGRQRGGTAGGSNDEREQTLNALLVEMDGFDQTGGVIVIAATNRPDVLDAALLRPGRFDRQIIVPSPDLKGRTDILDLYVAKIPLAPDVQTSVVARGTPGFSGADLANLVNEAALFAARNDKKFVDMSDFEAAKDKIIMGAERRIASMTDDERKNTAYHEAGHAVVGMALPNTDPVHKVTIVPRGRALGVTMMIPERDQYGQDREQLLQQISMLYGGRLAEELFLGAMSTGASDDIRRATLIATRMVTELGMSSLGPARFVKDEHSFSARHWSENKQERIDAEVDRILTECYERAKDILSAHRAEMHAMAQLLLTQETISASECNAIMGARSRQWPIPKQPLSTLAIECTL
jgi:cell division protease FtsH